MINGGGKCLKDKRLTISDAAQNFNGSAQASQPQSHQFSELAA